MLSVVLSKDAGSFLRNREPKHAKQIALKIRELQEDPEPTDSKLLKGSKDGFRRADIGEYRIIYRVEGETLEVALIGKRNGDEIYQRFKRKRRAIK